MVYRNTHGVYNLTVPPKRDFLPEGKSSGSDFAKGEMTAQVSGAKANFTTLN
jgi:hypothetical protein